ncbi:MAG: HAD-IIB family hydrolase [Gammaproteobacteria bacterium]
MKVLLCCDLDRTLLPNGVPEESPQARPLLRRIARRAELTLAYVSGRRLELLQAAIRDYGLPLPAYAAGDVGSTLYQVRAGAWHPWVAWERAIAPDWNGYGHDDLARVFADLDPLVLQEPEQQNRFKLSFYVALNVGRDALCAEMHRRLADRGVRASVTWSVDEARGCGLLDVLPERATKLHAVRFLMERAGYDEASTVFAGDSGNDLAALTGGLQAVLVANAAPDVRREALRIAQAAGTADRLYLARGGFLGMNGCYGAGVLEGLVHFLPATRAWLDGGADAVGPR